MCCAPFPDEKVKVTWVVHALPLFKSKHSFIDSSQPHNKECGWLYAIYKSPFNYVSYTIEKHI